MSKTIALLSAALVCLLPGSTASIRAQATRVRSFGLTVRALPIFPSSLLQFRVDSAVRQSRRRPRHVTWRDVALPSRSRCLNSG